MCAVALTMLVATADVATAQETQVETQRVRETPRVEMLRLSGSVSAPRTSHLSSAEAGQVSTLHVDLGTHVRQGERLLTLDSREAELERQRAQANVDQARAARDDARRLLDEANQLAEQQHIAASEQRQRQNALAAAEATLDAQQAAQALWELRITRHEITAPFDALITRRDTELGEWVTPGDTLLTLIDVDALMVDFSVPYSAYAQMDDATLEVRQEGDGQWHAARPQAQVPQDTRNRQFLLRATPSEALTLMPGMAVEGRLRIEGESGPSVPRDALIRRPDGSVSVWLARQESGQWRAVEQRVEIGNSHEGNVAVHEGVAVGDRVIVVGNERLEQGQALILGDDKE
ncbi:efflux RND transporter periplasmic adaptor subunit [Chromohalobacter israelensis]|uniref:efflux RND transporter periplasmic adaptor subunit n=1 Tax=Chromohalobacter israelensis TaxID=141390 RepID=UPI00265BE261|nr:efflux RND transporter periplasmic adaptor subunit [Chromohalobacter salexigens]MDO0947142.1 efflux RND transporter periplasmic adaptor subunit [Chromohalobacter salexigens]